MLTHDISQEDVSLSGQIEELITQSINNQYYPGAVILAGQRGKIIYRGAFGMQSLVPVRVPMRLETIFDTASLTKVIVTTTAVMQLVESGKLSLDTPVVDFWSEFNAHGKQDITIKMLLTHVSGLPAMIPSPLLNSILPIERQTPDALAWQGKADAIKYVLAVKPTHQVETQFTYSDINFVILGELIEKISGESLPEYAHHHIFKPLGMRNSFFQPSTTRRHEIAPTEIIDGGLRWGEVHDPSTWLMGGVAGMAGLFSTAEDIGLFAEMILRHGKNVLKPESVKLMTSPQTPAHINEVRGLGWDICSPYSCRGAHFSEQSFGHTGYTGTSLWIDPVNEAWLVMLSNRVHPHPAENNQFLSDRVKVADIIGKVVAA